MRISNNIGIRAHDINEHTFTVTHNYGLNNVQCVPFKFLPKESITDSAFYSPGLLTEINQKFKQAGIQISVLENYGNMIDLNENKTKQYPSNMTFNVILTSILIFDGYYI